MTKTPSTRSKLIAYALAGITALALETALIIWIITPTERMGTRRRR